MNVFVKEVSNDGRTTMWRHPDTGALHNEGAPAAVYLSDDGTGTTEEWWVNGNLHREDGPAMWHSWGGEQWWHHGKLHRENGPAVIWESGARQWYVNDNLHRTDGPAVEHVDGDVEWWVNGICMYNNKQFQKAAGLSDGEMAALVIKHGDIQ